MTPHGDQRTSRILRGSLAVTLLYITVCVVAGIRAGSLALLSEAGHNLSDAAALFLSLIAIIYHARPATPTKTYGYQRAGVLAAFVNSISLLAIAGYIMYEAVHRLLEPREVAAGVMIWVAAFGTVMNFTIAALLYRTSRDVNIRSAFLHEVHDTLSSAAIIVGGLLILRTGWHWIDPALSFGISLLILWAAWGIIRETLNILLEGTPRGVRLEGVAEAIRAIEGVNDVHDLHVWSLGSNTHALSCHIGIADIPPSSSERILRQVNEKLAADFHIHHTTIQFEHAVCAIAEGCVIPVSPEHSHGHHH
jgi:cobalt-zinc-cadmium efflux system protein